MAVQLGEGTALIWAEPIEREDYRVVPGDISEAIKWFEEKAGHSPKLIMLGTKNEKFASEVPEGIKVVCRGGVLMGEIWLTTSDTWGAPPTPPPEKIIDQLPSPADQPPKPPEKPPKRQKPVAKIKKVYLPTPNYATSQKQGRGRPPKYGLVDRTTAWRHRKREQQQLELPIAK